MRNICVIGAGYVGMVTAACFADLGNRVTVVEIDASKLERLRAGEMPIFEPGLSELVARNRQQGRLIFTESYAEGLHEAGYAFICVGTPATANGEPDMRYIQSAAESIAGAMTHPLLVINKSTVPVGTGDWVADIIRANLPQPIEFAVVSCPEFLREGAAIADFLHPDRIVLGATDDEAAEAVAQLFFPLRAPLMITDLRTAEMIKYASNAFPPPPASASSTKSPPFANASAPISRKWRRAWATTRASARTSCKRALASAAAASRKTSWRWRRWPSSRAYNHK